VLVASTEMPPAVVGTETVVVAPVVLWNLTGNWPLATVPPTRVTRLPASS
jgi:hypothetical protein